METARMIAFMTSRSGWPVRRRGAGRRGWERAATARPPGPEVPPEPDPLPEEPEPEAPQPEDVPQEPETPLWTPPEPELPPSDPGLRRAA